MDNAKHYPTHPGAEQPPIMKCDKLKAEPMIINDDYTALYYPKESVDAAIAELKAENRKLKHALWMARAKKARFLAMIIDCHPYTQVLHFTSRKRDESGKPLGVARTAMAWWKMFNEVEHKCLKKAEEYK